MWGQKDTLKYNFIRDLKLKEFKLWIAKSIKDVELEEWNDVQINLF